MVCSNSDWAATISIFPHIGKFERREVDFEILGGAGDIYNSTSMPNYCDGPYIHLGVYVNEVPSAWTEVWSDSYRSTARYWLPGVDLGRFRVFSESCRG